MLSRLLHRSTPQVEKSPEDPIKTIAHAIVHRVSDHKKPTSGDIDFFLNMVDQLNEQKDGTLKVEALLNRLAFNNGNTSYIEPYVEAAYRQGHNRARELGHLYSKFAVNNQPDTLVRHLLDGRFYTNETFPIYAFTLLGQAGVEVPKNDQETWLYKALASPVNVDHVQTCCKLLKLDPNTVKDAYGCTVLHNLMATRDRSDLSKLALFLDRAKALGLQASPDLFGRMPEEFGTPATKLIYARYFDTKQEPFTALNTYLQQTMHNFGGVYDIGAKDRNVDIKTNNPVQNHTRTTLFEHILRSNDMDVISEALRVIGPQTVQHQELEKMFAYVFLDKYVGGKTHEPFIAREVFALLQEQTPKDLSTALGWFLMHSDAYYKNYEVDPTQLLQYPEALEQIMDYQREHGLTDLLALESKKLDAIAAQVPALDTQSPGM